MLQQISCDEQAQAFCVNIVLQAMNAQDLGMRLYIRIWTLSKPQVSEAPQITHDISRTSASESSQHQRTQSKLL